MKKHIVILACLLPALAAMAQVPESPSVPTYTLLYNFGPLNLSQSDPGPVLAPAVDALGNVYGSLMYGGTAGNGALWKVGLLGDYHVLYSFAGGTSGCMVGDRLGITQSIGALFGRAGCGPKNAGMVWQYVGGKRKTLALGGTVGGGDSNIGFTQDPATGTLYGLTLSGYGKVVKIVNGQIVPVYSFKGAPTDGIEPQTEVVFDSSGNLFGITPNGGSDQFCNELSGVHARGCGVIYEVSGGVETIVHDFTADEWDGYPYDWARLSGNIVLDSAGNIYGLAAVEYENNRPLVWKYNIAEGTISVLHRFAADGSEGVLTQNIVIDPSGNLYGSMRGGGYLHQPDCGPFASSADPNAPVGCGTIWKIDTSGNFSLLWTLRRSNGNGAQPGSITYSNGALYGVTRFDSHIPPPPNKVNSGYLFKLTVP